MEEEKETVFIRKIKEEINNIDKMLLLELKYYNFLSNEAPANHFKDSYSYFRSTKDK